MRWTLGQIASRSGARIVSGEPPAAIARVAVDLAEAGPGALFVVFDHRSREVGRAFALGAAVLTDGVPRSVRGPLLVARDVVASLQRWAAADLLRLGPRITGITGSVGKTTMKEMIAHVLRPSFRVHKTAMNQNGQLGVPLTVLSCPERTEVLVLEMGISLPGEMRRLVALARPEVAVLGRLSSVHAQNFPSFAALVREKARIFEGGEAMPIVHVDSMPLLRPRPRKAITFGLDGAAHILAADVSARAGARAREMRFLVRGLGRRSFSVRLPLFGRAMVENALAALAVAHVFGRPAGEAVEALAHFRLDVPMRQAWRTTRGITVIDDAYNAAPASMAAGLELLREAPVRGRRIAVLGDMLELGRGSADLHRALKADVQASCDRLLTIGPKMRRLHEVAEIEAEHFDSVGALARRLRRLAKPGDAVLFKASRGIALERAVRLFEG